MKKYCVNCGYGNEYSGASPRNCGKCKVSFADATQKIVQIARHSSPQQTQETEEEYNSYIEFEPESISQEEIERIFLASVNKKVSLKDLMREGEATGATRMKAAPKKRGRPPKK